MNNTVLLPLAAAALIALMLLASRMDKSERKLTDEYVSEITNRMSGTVITSMVVYGLFVAFILWLAMH